MMLNREDRAAIEGLFERLENIEHASTPRDAEAETLIRGRLQQTPAAPYYMAQTILVQEHALGLAERRIEELEAELGRKPAGGGFLGGLLGGEGRPEPRQEIRRAGRGPWGPREDQDERAGRGGGGFLAGAAQTALGVTGGVLLGTAIASMLGGEAQAEEFNEADQPVDEQDQDVDQGDDDNGDFDVGGDF